jgi:UDP-2,3-diacylglucosamine hydrolase
MPRLFIADLHLTQDRPDILRAFLQFMDHIAPKADELYLLGDIFEAWIGDDAPLGPLSAVEAALKQYSDSGRQLYFQHGNRDFLIGDAFSRRTGAVLLPEIYPLQLEQGKAILLHGDQLCTDDLEYQSFRVMVRNLDWQAEFTAKPIVERVAIAKALREKSKSMGQQKSADIMDVNPQCVDETLAQHDACIMIHGHTHRPAVHELPGNKKRIVLGDWDTNLWYLYQDNESLLLIHDGIESEGT